VVQGRKTKENWLTGLQPGVRIQVSAQQSGRSEAEFVARIIEEMIGGTRFYSLDSRVASGQSELGITSLADFAVLCRLSAQTREFQEAFRNHGIPCQVAADPPFFKREPIKTLLALLRLSLTPEPKPKDIKLPAGMGRVKLSQAKLAEILRRAAGQTNNQEKIAFLLGEIFPAWRQEHGDERERLLDLAGRFGTAGTEEFLSLAALGSAADTLCPGMASVSLLTIHAAKGLEFACVFVPGCEEGLLPYTLFSDKEADREEERRLLYVAMTRAKSHLYLTHSRQRTLFGKRWQLPRSSFLDCIEEELLELSRAEPARKTAKAPQQRKLFDT
jgi:superfamily I DNA/RNA helicase